MLGKKKRVCRLKDILKGKTFHHFIQTFTLKVIQFIYGVFCVIIIFFNYSIDILSRLMTCAESAK